MRSARKKTLLAIIGLTGAAAVMFWMDLPPVGLQPARPSTKRQPTPGPLDILSIPHSGDTPLDVEIRTLQKAVSGASGRTKTDSLTRLGWAFVTKARLTYDAGFYTLARQAALSVEQLAPNNADARLLRGHVLHSQHRFAEAEVLARSLVSSRVNPQDHALLSDALMELGRIDEAVGACQKMADLQPSLPSYLRIAHLRWLEGDLAGATEIARKAAEMGSSRDAEPAAWADSALAGYEFQAGDVQASIRTADAALALVPDYAPALLIRGRALLALDRIADALESLRTAARKNPALDYQWTLADALRVNGRAEDAAKIENAMKLHGASEDARTLAVFLATRGEQCPMALELAKAELAVRKDVFTYDAIAWSALANGDLDTARTNMTKALSAGTQDARLFLHAAAIAVRDGRAEEGARFASQARAFEHTLLPGERELLKKIATQ